MSDPSWAIKEMSKMQINNIKCIKIKIAVKSTISKYQYLSAYSTKTEHLEPLAILQLKTPNINPIKTLTNPHNRPNPNLKNNKITRTRNPKIINKYLMLQKRHNINANIIYHPFLSFNQNETNIWTNYNNVKK